MLAAGIFALGAVIVGVVFNQDTAAVDAPEQAVLETPAPPEAVGEAAPKAADLKAEPEASPAPVVEPEPVVEGESTAEAAPAEGDDPDPETEAAAEAAAQTETEAEADVAALAPAPEVAAETTTETTTQTATATETAIETAPPAPAGPAFDVVRIDPFGSAVIAGRAAPGATVTLLADGAEVAQATADRNGKFVALFDLPPSDAPRSLSADMQTVDGQSVASNGTVLIAPSKPVEVAEVEATPTQSAPAVETAAAQGKPDAEADPVAEPDTQIAAVEPEAEQTPDPAPEPEAAPEPAPETATETATEAVATPVADPSSPAIVLADDSGVTVLQPADQPAAPAKPALSGVPPKLVANLVIDTITYDTQGDVALSGRGEGASFARVYLNDKPIKTVKIEADGTWRTPLPDVDAGVYRLRIDEVSSAGTVTSRVETPFQREEPEIVAQAADRPNAVTVQKGFTLWAIARARFGEGNQYVRVYEANRDLIRDPDLIYPGQIFELPEG